MATGRSVVLNGDLGSGKSTVSTLLARQLGIRRISVGDLFREMAQQRGMTALELNLHAELDDTIDQYVDRLQSDIATAGETVVVDSRLAWFYFRDALKVHLITDPEIAAHRVLGRAGSTVESYTSAAEARERLAERSESERVRFIGRYGADKTRLRNYDLVSTAPALRERRSSPGSSRCFRRRPLFIDPRRIYPTADAWACTGGPIRLGYVRPHFFVVHGHRAIGAAVRDGRTLVPAAFAAEDDEPIDGRIAAAYLATQCRPANQTPTSAPCSPPAA